MAAAGQRGLSALLKRGWNEIPVVLATSVMAVSGWTMTAYALYLYYSKGLDNRRYKKYYTVYRPDDPRVKDIRTDC